MGSTRLPAACFITSAKRCPCCRRWESRLSSEIHGIGGKKSYSQSIVASYTNRIICGCLAACLLAAPDYFTSPPCQAQTAVSSPSPQPTTPPTQQQEPIKIYTEEVLLP